MAPYIELTVLVLTTVAAAAGAAVSGITGDLCGKMNSRRYYLEAETWAEVRAVNVTLPPYSTHLATITPARLVIPFHYHRPTSPARHRRSEEHVVLRKPFTSRSLPPSPPSTPTPTTRPTRPPYTPPARMMKEEENHGRRKEDIAGEEEVALNQPFRCGAEFFTCPECHLEFTFTRVHLPSCSHDRSCRCDYVRIREPPYGGGGGRDVCSIGGGGDDDMDTGFSFATQTREAIVDFLYARRYAHAFTLTITARRNKYYIKGEANVTRGYIRSPYFPELYPKDHWMEYHLQALHPSTRIKVNFLDFLLSPWSTVEVEDISNNSLASYSGDTFRPPILVSSGPHLTLKFSGNGETARGFNLHYTFVSHGSLETYPASTDCGGFVTNFGGTITMMNMAQGETNVTLYDCVWIIQPPHHYAFKSHLSIRVVQFEDMVPGTQVEIRQGITSEDYLQETITTGQETETVIPAVGTTRAGGGGGGGRAAGDGGSRNKEHVAAVDTGFYVRLRGAFSKDSKMAIVYTTFSYLSSCYSLTDLMCQNHRCIPKMLRCDGFDHCGDNSDEPSSCYVGPGNKSLTPEDAAWWYQNTPNYYFPHKNNPFLVGGNGWLGVILLVSFILLVLVIFILLSYMFKTGLQHGQGNNRERRSGATSRDSLSDEVEIFDAAADDPPLYEPPPDYEDVIKLILSGNNLKLVRRPGGVTAWVPDKLAGEGTGQPGGDGRSERPLRTRHASLDLEQSMEVVLWNASGIVNTWTNGRPVGAVEASPAVTAHQVLGHVQRSSLPVAVLPEELRGPSHGVSMASETISEAHDGLDSLQPAFRPIQPAISSSQISIRSFDYDSSGVSTPGPSTPRVRTPAGTPGRRLLKKGKQRRKKTSTARHLAKREDSAPPSYGDAIQQPSPSVTQVRCLVEAVSATTPLPGLTLDSTSQMSESTQTSLDLDNDHTPTDRLQTAREMFQCMSQEEREMEAPCAPSIRPPPAPAVRGRHVRTGSGGSSISRDTVWARKAMLLQGEQRVQATCSCHGARSCATSSEAKVSMAAGSVRTKVSYYEATRGRDSNEAATTARPDTTTKKWQLVRNKPAPATTLVHNHHHLHQPEAPVEIEQEAWCPAEGVVPGEELERPLITPVLEVAPMIVATGEQVIPSIRTRVQLYDQMSQPSTPCGVSSLLTTTGEVCSMRPGLMQEARSRIMTALHQDMPRFLPQDSDDCSDSQQLVLVPYHSLSNDEATTPETSESLTLPPPLRHKQAESIELWDTYSQSHTSPSCQAPHTPLQLPSPASGAVPKKQPAPTRLTLTIQAVPTKPALSHSQEEAQMEAKWSKSGLNLPLADKFSPATATVTGREDIEDKEDSECPGRASSEDDLHVMNLRSSMMVSEDDILPPLSQHLDITLNKTLESNPEQQAGVRGKAARAHPQPQPQPELQWPQPQPRPHTKFPVPSPRGSKNTPSGTVIIPVQRGSIPEAPALRCGPQPFTPRPKNATNPPHPKNSPSPHTSRTSSPKPQCKYNPQSCQSDQDNPRQSTPEPASPSPSPISHTQPISLSPQMVSNGVITIQVGKRTCYD